MAPEAEIAISPPSQLRRLRRLRPRIPPVIRSPPTDPAPPAAQAATSARPFYTSPGRRSERRRNACGLIPRVRRRGGSRVCRSRPLRPGFVTAWRTARRPARGGGHGWAGSAVAPTGRINPRWHLRVEPERLSPEVPQAPAAIEAEANAELARLQDGRHRKAGAILADAERQARELEGTAVEAAERDDRRAGEPRLTPPARCRRPGCGTRTRPPTSKSPRRPGPGRPRSASGATTPRSWPRCSPKRAPRSRPPPSAGSPGRRAADPEPAAR